MSDHKIAVYISSRNNYDMLQREVMKNVNLKDFYFVNVDDSSSYEEMQKGKSICKDNNITFISNKGRGLFAAADTAITHIKDAVGSTEFVLWLTHDCYPLDQDFIDKLDVLARSGALSDFGAVGFNTLWRHQNGMNVEQFIRKFPDRKFCATMGRAVLTPVPGAGWYRSNDWEMNWDVWGKNIAVESVVDMSLLINTRAFDEITPDESYQHFCWADDMCLQFMMNGRYNVTLADHFVYHDQSIKEKYGIPKHSYRAASHGDMKHFCKHDSHYPIWLSKWKFDRNWQKTSQKIPDDVVASYEGSLIHDFMTHDRKLGPLKTFEIDL